MQTQPFKATFGDKRTRKRPKLSVDSYEDLVAQAATGGDEFSEKVEAAGPVEEDGGRAAARDAVYEKGQSKRIWGELYKVGGQGRAGGGGARGVEGRGGLWGAI